MRSSSASGTCPYCSTTSPELTDDHVFPNFLGGRATVRVCRNCNSKFGHAFEGQASTQIKKLQVFISHFGLDLTRNAATWPAALSIGEKTYDLISGPQGVQYQLAQPYLERDDSGEIVGGQARSRAEANQFARNLKRKGLAREVTIEAAPPETIENVKLDVDISLNPEMFKFAAKLAANAVVFSGRQSLIQASSIVEYLHGRRGWNASAAYSDTAQIRKLRPGLSHTVYVELGERGYAIVLIFGDIEIFVPLRSGGSGAILGYLDPLSGDEVFKEISPVDFEQPHRMIDPNAARQYFERVLRDFSDEAVARGATHPPNLYLGALDLGKQVPTQWSDSTLRLLK